MLRKLSITCPQCHISCRLYLGSEAPVVVIRCPNCGTSLMSVGDDAIVLNEKEMEAIRRGDGNALILRRLVDSGRNVEGAAPRARPLAIPMRRSDAAAYRTVQEQSEQRRPITHDDVVDLHRELAMCLDSAHFIEQMA